MLPIVWLLPEQFRPLQAAKIPNKASLFLQCLVNPILLVLILDHLYLYTVFLAVIVYFMHAFLKSVELKCRVNQMRQVLVLLNMVPHMSCWCLCGVFLFHSCCISVWSHCEHICNEVVLLLYIASAFLSGHLTSMMHFLWFKFLAVF